MQVATNASPYAFHIVLDEEEKGLIWFLARALLRFRPEIITSQTIGAPYVYVQLDETSFSRLVTGAPLLLRPLAAKMVLAAISSQWRNGVYIPKKAALMVEEVQGA